MIIREQGMRAQDLKKAAPDAHEAAAGKEGETPDDACRCKEASRMTPRELLELMFRDLALWKKKKKE
jgi:hypothetical protein